MAGVVSTTSCRSESSTYKLGQYLLLAEVLEVGVVEVQEGVLEGSDDHGAILKQCLIQNCTCKIDKKLIFV